jgi:hypothetical protein
MNASGFQEAENGGGREREGGKEGEQNGGSIETTGTVRSTGGVKALLKQLNSKYSDSHVQLPDGTVPGGKPVPLVRSKSKFSNQGTNGNENSVPKPAVDGAGGSASGVKARLAEINSKHKNSFVRLPDGTVPAKPVELRVRKESGAEESGIILEQEESASVSAYDGFEDTAVNYVNHAAPAQQAHDSKEHHLENQAQSQPRPPPQQQQHIPVDQQQQQHLESQNSAASTLYSDYVPPTPAGGVIAVQQQPAATAIQQAHAQQQRQDGYSDYSAVPPPPVYPNYPQMKPPHMPGGVHMDARQQQQYMMDQRRVNPPAAPPLLNQPGHAYPHATAPHHAVRQISHPHALCMDGCLGA